MAVSVEPLTPPSTVEREIESRIEEVWANAGYVTESGERDTQAMQDAAYKAVRSRIAHSKQDKAEKAITKGELYAAVFPAAPGTDGKGDPTDEYDKIVAERLERDVWSLMQAKHSGAVQKRLGEESSSLVLCQAIIRRKLDKAPAAYLTDNPRLIMEDSVDKEVKSLERKAENLRRQLDMVLHRHPELTDQVLKRVGQAMGRTKAELMFPSTNAPASLPEKAGE